MKILIITNSYPPEIRSTSHLMYEMATEMQSLGHEVTVLTSFPGYNLAEGVDREAIQEVTDEDGVKVLRARTLPLKKVGYLRRGLAEVGLPFNLLNLLKKNADDFDAIWVFSPPLTLALLAGWLKRKYKATLLMNAQDIFPQNGIDLGIITNPALIFAYEKMERKAYAFADYILVHSEQNRDFLVDKKQVPESKLVMQYNWVDIEPFDRVQRTGRFREAYGLDGQVVVLFGGVFGPSQGLEAVLEVAEHFQDDPELAFLLVGDGSQKPKLEALLEDKGLDNVVIRPFVSKDEYPALVKDADIGLACLAPEVKTPVVPGKIQGYMAAGVPIWGILNKESDGHGLVKEAEAGRTVNAGDIEAAIEALKELKDSTELRQRLGQNGREYAEQNLAKSACIQNILGLIEQKA